MKYILSSTWASSGSISNRSSSKSSYSSQKKVISVATENSVVCILVSGATSGAWVEDLVCNELASNSSCSSSKTSIKSSITSEKPCVWIVAVSSKSCVLWFRKSCSFD